MDNDALDTIQQLCAQVQKLQPELERLGADIPSAVPSEVAQLHDLAREVLREGPILDRNYR